MKDWEYIELIECVKKTYSRFFEASKNTRHAISRLADDYANLGYIEDIIVDVIISEIMILKQEFILGYVKDINQRLSEFNLENLKNELSEIDQEDLINRINKVISSFREITNNG